MLVTIIITTKNEALHLGALLESIKTQTYQTIETIIVDNHSTDKTVSIAKKYTRYVYNQGPERSAQRNFGLAKAKGKAVIFLDADMILGKTVISDCAKALEYKNIQAIVIPEKSFGIGFWARCKTLERQCYLNIDWIESARCFRTDVVKKLGGYDQSLSGPEDFDLPQRLKHIYGAQAIARIKSFILHNEGNLQLTELLKRKFYYGKSIGAYRQKVEHTHFVAKQSNPFARYKLFFQKTNLRTKFTPVFWGMLGLKTAELVALAFGAVVGKK